LLVKRFEWPIKYDVVLLDLAVAWMSHALGEVAVVCQENKAATIAIKSADCFELSVFGRK
jgi:hypothetical protein